MDLQCPGCRTSISGGPENELPEAGQVLTCAHCAYIGVWEPDQHTWRPVTKDEHAALLEDENFLEALSYGFAFRQLREKDRERLNTTLHAYFDPHHVPEATIRMAVTTLMDAQFHTHPTDEDLRTWGLEKFTGYL